MKIWTIQPESVYKILLSQSVIHCDATKSEFLQKWGFEQAYKWMAEQMMKQVGNPPDGVAYPIWAWHTLIDNNEDEQDIDAENQWVVKEKSWQKIFDVFSLQDNSACESKCSYIQAIFWELHLDHIVDVRYFKGRRS